VAVHRVGAEVVSKPRWRRRVLALVALVATCSLLVAGCGAAPDGFYENVEESAQPITGSDAVDRAMQWVNAKLKYCQAPNHAHDYDSACSSVCNRKDNHAWNPYRSDCSGLISWAWGLPPPGRTTLGFAPYDNSISHTIKGIDMTPGDAVNNTGHVMLFKHWVQKGKRAVFIEEPGCSSSTPYAHQVTSDVSISGSNVHVSYNGESFHAIRYNKKTSEKTLKAKAVKKWSNAKRYHGKKADYIACAGAPVKMSFTFKNVGSAVWRDVKGRGKSIGNDVFLVTASGKADKITGHKRYSLRNDQNHVVRGDHKAKNCSNKNGCRRTTFVQGAIKGNAPKKPGVYHSRWRLRDYSKAWGKHSHGFGPKVDLSLEVVSCEQPKQECGCRVWCSDGKSHKLAADIGTNAQCKSVAETFCKPAKYLDHSFEACAAAPNPGSTPSSTGGQGGAGPGASTDPAGAGGEAGATSADVWNADDGSEDDPNGYGIDEGDEDPDAVEDDPDFADDDGFDGDADSSPDTATAGGCSISTGDRQSDAPWGAGVTALFVALAEVRRRAKSRAQR
jgi:hypothetical protein